MEKCKFPDCHQPATKTWALVPLCPDHFYEIVVETHRFYKAKNEMKIKYDERINYQAIEHLTPWGRTK